MPPTPSKGGFGEDAWVARVVQDPANPPNAALLTGYRGASPVEGSVRLYLSADLSQYVDLPSDSILHVEPLPTDTSPLGGAHVWVRQEALGKAAASRAFEVFAAGAGPGAPGPGPGPLPPTAPPLCQPPSPFFGCPPPQTPFPQLCEPQRTPVLPCLPPPQTPFPQLCPPPRTPILPCLPPPTSLCQTPVFPCPPPPPTPFPHLCPPPHTPVLPCLPPTVLPHLCPPPPPTPVCPPPTPGCPITPSVHCHFTPTCPIETAFCPTTPSCPTTPFCPITPGCPITTGFCPVTPGCPITPQTPQTPVNPGQFF